MSIFRNQRVYFPLIGVCFLVSSLIALNTNNYHPDEGMHIDAFCYFERHWWAPSVNSDEVWYGQDGWSRVYNGELVYQVYGRLSQFISPLRVGLILLGARTLPVLGVAPPQLFIAYNSQQTSLQCHETTYRLFNSCLLVITLFLLFRAGTTHGLAIILALMLICIPQVTYTYSYANSDAWGISFSLFVFLFAVIYDHPLASRSRILGLSLLTGMVLLSKQPYWVSLLFSYSLIAFKTLKRLDPTGRGLLLRRICVLGILTLCVIAPVKIVNPWIKGYSSTSLTQMREERASAEYKPSHPTQDGYRLAARGWRFTQMLATYGGLWFGSSAESFYGRPGMMDVRFPRPVYLLVTMLSLLAIITTYGTLIYRWDVTPDSLRLLLILAPLAVGLSVLSSLYNSWIYDVQPQGRYLYSALAPCATLLGGTVEVEPIWINKARTVSFIVLFVLAVCLLWQFVLNNPLFR